MTDQRTSRARLLVLLTSLALALLLLAPAIAAAGVKDQIKAALSRHSMAGSGTSVVVHDLSAKRNIIRLRPDVLRLPASNQKLVTAAAALASWTKDHRFQTQLFINEGGIDDEGVIHGDVYLRGLGDPTLSTATYQKKHLHIKTADIQDFVRKLKALGVTRITGRVRADEGYFDKKRKVDNWRSYMTLYCSPLSALTLNQSFAGEGSYATDPAINAALTLTRRLRNADIRVTGAPKHGVTPAAAILVYTERSARLPQVLARMNKPSDNFIAEILLKGLGAGFGDGGTTAAGAVVAKRFLQSADIDKGYRIRDGSGLSYQDKLTARTVVKLLVHMSKRADYKVFRNSLALAGVNGTLSKRMRGTAAAGKVYAKTGTLNNASSLSGYVTSANGHLLCFSILMNGSPIPLARAHAAQDAVAVVLARSRP